MLAVVGAIVGPRIVGPQSHSAGAAFAYEPPEGFVRAKSDSLLGTEDTQIWVFEDKKNFDGSSTDKTAALTRVVVTHSNKEMSVEEADLSKLAAEMPKAFEDSCTWVHRRHELRTRADGARVGLIEGDCNRDLDLSSLGVPSQKVRSRKLQLMFPDDTGTSIVTASYPTEQAARWEPLFEATIPKARGVATRTPSPAVSIYAAWAAAGAVLGWLATAIFARKSLEVPSREKTTDPPRATRQKNDEDQEDDAS